MTTSLARTEREELCDTALRVGPDAPTLCDGWSVRDLLAHLRVREKSPVGAVGIVVPALSGLTDRAMARTADRDFTELVAEVRRPGLTPFAIPAVEVAANTAEMLVHHEDIRRAQPDWAPRELTRTQLDAAWRSLTSAGRMLARSAGVPLTVAPSDTGQSAALVRGGDPVVVTGPVVELVMMLFGRTEYRDVTLEGPDEKVARVRETDFGM